MIVSNYWDLDLSGVLTTPATRHTLGENQWYLCRSQMLRPVRYRTLSCHRCTLFVSFYLLLVNLFLNYPTPCKKKWMPSIVGYIGRRVHILNPLDTSYSWQHILPTEATGLTGRLKALSDRSALFRSVALMKRSFRVCMCSGTIKDRKS
jgi:hypothetical protein